jgi:hypothetical protein
VAKIKLIGAVRRVNGVFHEFGAVVDVDKATADRMIAGGSAVDPDTDVQAPNSDGEPVTEDLESLTIPKLKALAAERGVDLDSGANKAEIVAALEAAG